MRTGPKAQRSRACDQCRERRVKCDETPEICQQCKRLGLACSGPIQGSVIIDMTARVTKPRAKRKRESKVDPKVAAASAQSGTASPSPATPQAHAPVQWSTVTQDAIKQEYGYGVEPAQRLPPPQGEHRVSIPDPPRLQTALVSRRAANALPTPTSAVTRSPDAKGAGAIAVIRNHYRLPMLYEPSKVEILDTAFLAHFIELNSTPMASNRHSGGSGIPWITSLPTTASPTAVKPALKLALRAAAMAFYAQVHRDVAVLTDSYRWYVMGLNVQRSSLVKWKDGYVPSDDEVLAPMVLGLYEVYAGTTPTSVFHHLTACTKIIEMRGPENCTTGVAGMLYRAIRVSDAHTSVIFNRPSVFNTYQWRTLPWLLLPKHPHQFLHDIILDIPDCVALTKIPGTLNDVFSKDSPPGTDLEPARRRATQLLHDLESWGAQYPEQCSMGATNNASPDPGTQAPVPQSPDAKPLPAPFLAFSAAIYHAIHLILTLLIHKVTHPQTTTPISPPMPSMNIPSLLNPPSIPMPLSNPEPQVDRIAVAIADAATVFQIADFMESHHPVGFDFLRAVFPLVAVAVVGPRDLERKIAKETLQRWGERRGLGGLTGSWFV